jgi:tetratricopeptide (TPR) repeat protein
MPTDPTPRLIDAFDTRVTTFTTASFSLAEDLDWLDRLRVLRAPVATILHGARILEVLAREALATSQLTAPNDGLNDALRLLLGYHLLSKETFALLDRLRDLGNKARHATRKVNFDDAEQGYAIVLRGMHWYFCEFPDGPGLKCLSVHNQPLDVLLPANVALLLTMLESRDLDKRGFLDTLGLHRPHCPLLLSPVLAAVLVERLLDGGRTDEAQTVLNAARERFADDIRLRQLQGLLWSRAGRLEDACAWLEAIETTDSAADEETQGILAGAYKRRAAAEPERRDEWLQACHAKYQRGWQQSRGANTYLGINAAALALWLGQPRESTTIATSVRDLLESRRRGLARGTGSTPRFLNCWDQLTLAEAHLLLKDWDTAREYYREAVERFPKQTKALEVARDQANEHLRWLGRSDLIGSMFPG